MSTAAQRFGKAVSEMEYAATDLLKFVETYNATPNAAEHQRSMRNALFSYARRYSAAVRRVARLRV